MTSWLRSSARAVAIGYIAFGVAALTLFAAPLWIAWQRTIEDGRAEILKSDAQRLAEVFHRGGAQGLTGFIRERVGLQIAGERILLLTDSARRPLAGNLDGWPAGAPTHSGVYTVTLQLAGHPLRVTLVHTVLPGNYHLLVGRDKERFAPLEHYFWWGLTLATLVLAAAGLAGGMLIRRAILARVQGIQGTVAAIMQGRLSHRLETRASGDEFDTLAQTINGMLEQIEHLIEGVRHVSNSIAHDLRTPLAELRSRLEELAVARPPPAETFAELDTALVDIDRVMGIFDALLRLARIDSGVQRAGFLRFDVTAVAAEAVELYLPAAELKGVSLRLKHPGPTQICGDPVLLAQAVGNLLDNALKYVQPGGCIQVQIAGQEAHQLHISIADDGPGISDAEKPKVVQRFYRGDASRGTPGVGLGLSLVEAVVKLHGGTLRLVDNHPGLRVDLSLVPHGA